MRIIYSGSQGYHYLLYHVLKVIPKRRRRTNLLSAETYLDLSYGADAQQKIDMYLPCSCGQIKPEH